MHDPLSRRLARIADCGPKSLLNGGLKGIEKENLRVTRDGQIAQNPHPAALGSALTHPYITTDYSEALIELRTPPFADVRDAIQFLFRIQQFAHAHIGDQLLWAASMPCSLQSDESIPIAQYGRSNVGMMKHVYRRGLAYRYGRAMQAIAGVHFNYSLPHAFWPIFQELEGDKHELQAFVSEMYFRQIRNFQRMAWLIPYLFGCSPAVCKSFLELRAKDLSEFDSKTCYEHFATSLRMSDIGYKTEAQESLDISYNSLDEYAANLSHAIQTPYPPYERIGVRVDGDYRQLNANILQIENEYYSFVRPKRRARSGETPVSALKRRGVEYTEIRAVDVSTFDPVGVNEQQLHFLEAFSIFCVLQDSPPIDPDERKEADSNQQRVACRGRDPDISLRRGGRPIALRAWAEEICERMEGVCAILDSGAENQEFLPALSHQRDKIVGQALLPSAQILAEMQASKRSFFEYALNKSQEHASHVNSMPLAKDEREQFVEQARQSLTEQGKIEETDEFSFREYLERYFRQQ